MTKEIRLGTTTRKPIPPSLRRAETRDVVLLCALYDGHLAASEVFLGLVNQPRHKDAAQLDAWREYHLDQMERIVDHLRAAKPGYDEAREERARVLTNFEFRRGAGLKSAAALAASLALA